MVVDREGLLSRTALSHNGFGAFWAPHHGNRVLLAMRRNLVLAMTFAATIAACSRAPDMDADMKRDLQAASAGSIELAPQGNTVKTVSALESNRPEAPKVAPVRQVKTPAKAPPTAPQPTQQPRTTEPTAPAPAPASTPRVQSCPGGCKSINDVIRNAPFPIKPATKKPSS